MSGGTKQFLRRCLLPQSLPYLKQGSTLSIRSQLKADLRIQSHWRDDGQLSFSQHSRILDDGENIDHDRNSSTRILLSRKEDKMTSLGREDPHVLIHVIDNDGVEHLAPNDDINSESRHATTMFSLPPPTLAEGEIALHWMSPARSISIAI